MDKTKDNNIDVLVVGRSCLDYIAVVSQFPEENQKTPLDFRLTEGGGNGGTASCCISRLDGKVAYVGKLGDDDEGRYCVGRLKDAGVASDFVEIVTGGRTPVAYAFITEASGARTIIYEHNELPKIEMNHTLRQLIEKAEVVLIDPEATYLAKETKIPQGLAGKLVYDCERWRKGIEDSMATADYFIPSSDFLNSAELNFDDISLQQKIWQLNKMVSGVLIVTHGEDGAYYIFDDKLYQVAVPEVKTVDTIGAGDNFHGAFAFALAKEFDIHQSVKLSVAVASLSCREYGGRKGVPNIREALEVATKLKERVVK